MQNESQQNDAPSCAEKGRFGMSKQERITLLGLLVTFLLAAYLSWQLFLVPGAMVSGASMRDMNSNIQAFGMVLLVGSLVIRNFSKGVFEDERDRQIDAKGMKAGYYGLVQLLILTGIIVQVPTFTGYVGSRSPAWMGMYLLLCLCISAVVIFAVKAFCYWRDRQ
jgi:ABC-type glycerol-3-phosphate transport system permease component